MITRDSTRLPTVYQTYGYCASIIGSTIGQPGWYTYFGLPQQGEPGYEGETTRQIATANGLFSAGGAAGALLLMWAADQYGRKRNIQLGSFFSVLGGALQGGAATLGQVVVVLLPVARCSGEKQMDTLGSN